MSSIDAGGEEEMLAGLRRIGTVVGQRQEGRPRVSKWATVGVSAWRAALAAAFSRKSTLAFREAGCRRDLYPAIVVALWLHPSSSHTRWAGTRHSPGG